MLVVIKPEYFALEGLMPEASRTTNSGLPEVWSDSGSYSQPGFIRTNTKRKIKSKKRIV
jgi:hypothetical protein